MTSPQQSVRSSVRGAAKGKSRREIQTLLDDAYERARVEPKFASDTLLIESYNRTFGQLRLALSAAADAVPFYLNSRKLDPDWLRPPTGSVPTVHQPNRRHVNVALIKDNIEWAERAGRDAPRRLGPLVLCTAWTDMAQSMVNGDPARIFIGSTLVGVLPPIHNISRSYITDERPIRFAATLLSPGPERLPVLDVRVPVTEV